MLNKKVSFSFSFLIVFMAFVLILASCASVARVSILGNWKSENNDFIKFYNSGEVIQSTVLGINTSGYFRIIDDDKLAIEYQGITGLLGPQIMVYKLSINELIVTYPLIGKVIYTRY